MKAYLKTLVNLGVAEKDGITEWELADDALKSPATINAEFADPKEDDPLGTTPKDPTTVLGRAIDMARQQRSTDYDWSSLQSLQRSDKAGFDDLVLDERRDVLEIVLRM